MTTKRTTKPKPDEWRRQAQIKALIAAGDHMANLLVSFGIISSGMATWEEAKERLEVMNKESRES